MNITYKHYSCSKPNYTIYIKSSTHKNTSPIESIYKNTLSKWKIHKHTNKESNRHTLVGLRQIQRKQNRRRYTKVKMEDKIKNVNMEDDRQDNRITKVYTKYKTRSVALHSSCLFVKLVRRITKCSGNKSYM